MSQLFQKIDNAVTPIKSLSRIQQKCYFCPTRSWVLQNHSKEKEENEVLLRRGGEISGRSNIR